MRSNDIFGMRDRLESLASRLPGAVKSAMGVREELQARQAQ
jgi:hypothetical protein